MKEKWKGFWLLLAGVAIGAMAFHLITKPIDTSAYENEIARLKDSVATSQGKINNLATDREEVKDSLVKLREAYLEALREPISIAKADSLRSQVIEKGRVRYGSPQVSQPPVVESPIYGNLALDELSVFDQRDKVNTKIIGLQKGIITTKDSIITTQTKIVKAVKRSTRKSKLKTFLQGGFFGFVLSLLFLI